MAPPADLTGARIAFAGTPDFAVPCLQMLLDAGAVVPVVLTQPDRPAGRGRRVSAIGSLATGVAFRPFCLDRADPGRVRFEQRPAEIGQGTGGVTESIKNRVVTLVRCCCLIFGSCALLSVPGTLFRPRFHAAGQDVLADGELD